MDEFYILLILQLVTMAWSRGNATEVPRYDVRETIGDIVNGLCPKTDICAANATNAELSPKGTISRGLVSCCQGCSCHPDCKDKGNCCYPDHKTFDDSTSPKSQSECLYTRLGRPEYLNGFVLAFDTIVSPPADGCLDSRPVRVSENVILEPTCDDIDVTPLGWYFPVYSKERSELYKNILCARCHGVREIESFWPRLFCKKSDKKSPRLTSVTESLYVLKTGILSPRCYVDFKHNDISTLENQQCFKDIINNCSSDTMTPPMHQRSLSFDFDVIQNLCESGFSSPTVTPYDGKVYKNVFCSLCGKTSKGYVPLYCTDMYEERGNAESFAFLFNPTVMHTIDKMSQLKTNTEICLNEPGTGKTCRRIYCSTGKVRNKNGNCVMVGNFLGMNEIQIEVKLTSKEQIDFGEYDVEGESNSLVEAILKSSPWPKEWKCTYVYNRKDKTVCDEKAVASVRLTTEKQKTQKIYQDMEISINRLWKPVFGNKTYMLEQSFSEYKLSFTFVGDKTKILPSWQGHESYSGPDDNFFKCGLMEWKLAYWQLGTDQTAPFLNKLCLCNQILLQPDEIILGPENTYLQSNLTKRALHDNEFDIIEDAEGVHAMVCLEDTIFATNKTNAANSLQRHELTGLILVYLVYRI